MLQDILETVHFIRDNAVTKDEFHEEVNRLDSRIGRLDERVGGLENHVKEIDHHITDTRDEMIAHIDQFIALHNKLDTELVSLRNKCDRLESQLRQVFLHLNLQPVN